MCKGEEEVDQAVCAALPHSYIHYTAVLFIWLDFNHQLSTYIGEFTLGRKYRIKYGVTETPQIQGNAKWSMHD